jgi:hypothetical protein
MAITVDWATKVINVPKADTTLIQSTPTEIRQLNLDTFRLTLRDLEDDFEGMPFDKTHNHNTTITVGGVTLARVVEIINGYTVTFEDGQYAVNLVGANSNVGDVVNVNQVSVRSANSAGLQDLSTILSAAYQGEVVVDFTNGQSGTDVPIGTRSTPVNNIADALTIAAKEGANTLRFAESTTLSNVTIPQGFILTSDSPALVKLTVNPSATVQGCEFINVTFEGTADGNNIIRECLLLNVDYVSGFIFQCSLEGTISIVPGSLCALLSCFSNTLAGQPNPIIDFNGNGKVILRDYQGAIELINHTDTSGDGDLCLDFSSGVCIIRPSVTAGFIPIRGICRVVDESTGTANVVDETVNQLVEDNAASLGIINQGVQNASLLIPHTTDL